jgi:hypothetical protein
MYTLFGKYPEKTDPSLFHPTLLIASKATRLLSRMLSKGLSCLTRLEMPGSHICQKTYILNFYLNSPVTF